MRCHASLESEVNLRINKGDGREMKKMGNGADLGKAQRAFGKRGDLKLDEERQDSSRRMSFEMKEREPS